MIQKKRNTNRWKRILAGLLTVSMVFGKLPVVTRAEGVSTGQQPQETATLTTLFADESFISLEKAKAVKRDNTGAAYLEQAGNTLTVINAEGLILLSNVEPTDYKNFNIKLSVLDTQNDEYDLTKTLTVDGTEYSYRGLGRDGAPYAGQMSYEQAADRYWLTTIPVFQALSEKAELPEEGITFQLIPEGADLHTSTNTEFPLLALQVVDEADGSKGWKVSLAASDNEQGSLSENSQVPQIGGLIGAITDSAVALEVSVETSVSCSNTSGVTGFLCHTLTNSTLTVSDLSISDKGNISVTAPSSDAGGLVGIASNSTLVLNGGFSGTVTATKGNAGGLVGSATDTKIMTSSTSEGSDRTSTTTSGNFLLTDVTVSATASKQSVGGIAGVYNNTKETDSIDLTGVTLSAITLNGNASKDNGNAGGLFGSVTNKGSLTINKDITVNSTLNAGTVGGLIGAYTANELSNTLLLENMTIYSSRTNASRYGGVIGKLLSTCYVEMKSLTVSVSNVGGIFGGLAAEMGSSTYSVMLHAGDVVVSGATVDNSDSAQGGLVGYLRQGVVRLQGEANLSDLTIKAGKNCGRIVGQNGDGLIYAVPGWKSTINSSSNASNIGNWSEVVLLDDERLAESTEGLLSFDPQKHTVTVYNVAGTNLDGIMSYTLNNITDFAGYALAFNYSENAVLKIINDVNPDHTQKLSLNSDIDLSGTGILGIGRDNGVNGDDSTEFPAFKGAFDGQGHTITLDIGHTITLDIGHTTGTLWAYQWGSVKNQHGRLGLFASAGDNNVETVIESVSVTGQVNMSVLNNGSGKDSYPLCISGVIAYQKGKITYKKVISKIDSTVDKTADNKNNDAYVAQAGLVAQCADNSTATFQSSIWDKDSKLTNTRTNNKNYVGGFIGYANKLSLTTEECTLSGTISLTNETDEAHVGGLVADNKEGSIQISDLLVTGASITTKAKSSKSSGGLLGYSWRKCTVTFGTVTAAGVTITDSSLITSGRFGGLVYQASGYWDATRTASISFAGKNIVQGKTAENNTSALLISDGSVEKSEGLYLEIGTWGTSSGAAFSVASDSVALKLNETSVTADSKFYYFDELVGKTQRSAYESKNGVISLATSPTQTEEERKIDISGRNTYESLLGAKFVNGNTRYYYNLDSYRCAGQGGLSTLQANALDSPEKVLSWSVSQYAASNIRGYFCENSEESATISGTMDLTGYSYYPVSPLANVKVQNSEVTFAYDKIQLIETGNKQPSNKQPSNADCQHYLMHYGLFYNMGKALEVSNTSFAGTVGKNSNGSGAVVFGKISGSASNNTVLTVSLKQICLKGICVSNVDTSTSYAPLLINQVSEAVTLIVNDLITDDGYNMGSNTAYAATSLIGKVGSSTATKLNLQFSDIALDARTAQQTNPEVKNNGSVVVNYHTYHTIFTHATLLESFRYASESNGKYNFNTTDSKVTYGKEISNTDSGRNLQLQYGYYDDPSIYVWDGDTSKVRPTTPGAIKTYFSSDYLRYVYKQEITSTDNYRELDINIRPVHLDQGCGTYGDPYLITDGKQLVALADFLTAGSANDWVVNINTDVYNEKSQNKQRYHVNGDTSANDVKYLCNSTSLYEANGSDGTYMQGESADESITVDGIRAYLRNAYYQIQNDITISTPGYSGIGGKTADTDTFSGVIIGKEQDDHSYPTVTISIKKSNTKAFGGLIQYSQGSVVKNLNINYSGTAIEMKNTAVPSSSNNPFFGGVVGYCMGGDTVIDNVSVTYQTNPFILSENSGYQRLIAAGGYVGLVGGGKETSYERKGGGVVFRKMDGHTNSFSGYSLAKDEGDGATYFYYNPYVGRVLDGYVCYEGENAGTSTLDNTDKNYKIPDIQPGTGDLKVDEDFNTEVSSAQGMWLLSAIVNSGAAAMDITGNYTDVSGTVTAYQLGKPRSGNYDHIGTEEGKDDLKDEAYWGGVVSASALRVSRLVKNYTTPDNSNFYAARLTGSNGNSAQNNGVSLIFNADEINMTSYGNGFRGVGASYGYSKGIYGSNADSYKSVMRRSIYAKTVVPSAKIENVKITLAMKQKLYREEATSNTSTTYSNQGVGLFTNIGLSGTVCTMSGLTFSGSVEMSYYLLNDGKKQAAADKIYGESGAGAFAAQTLYDSQERNVIMDSLSLDNLTVSGAANAGGVVGAVSPTKTTITFNNITANVVKVSTYINHDGNVGGLVGYFAPRDSGRIIIRNEQLKDGFSNLEVEITATNERSDRNYAAVGGLVGKCESKPFDIQNVQFQGTVTAQRCNQVGGLIGCANGGGTVKQCQVADLTVHSIDSTDVNDAIGGLVGYSGSGMNIEATSISGTTKIYSDYTQAINNDSVRGCMGGFIGRSKETNTISGCAILGQEGNPIRIFTNAFYSKAGELATGGLVGYDVGTTVKNTSLSYVNILGSSDVGGIVGHHNNNVLSISNCEIKNCNIGGPWSATVARVRAGMIAGYTKNEINGYNILARDTTVGISTQWEAVLKKANNAVVDNSEDLDSQEGLLTKMKRMGPETMGLQGIATNADKTQPTSYGAIQAQNTPIKDYYVGAWIGLRDDNNSDKLTRLVAVACDQCFLPWQDYGDKSTEAGKETIQVTYADYPVDQTDQTTSASPYLDSNPVGALQVKEDRTAQAVSLTGNAVATMSAVTINEESGTQTQATESVAKIILNESSSTSFGRVYCNVPDYSSMLEATSPVYLTGYQEEEGHNTTDMPDTVDFPLLVINSNVNREVNAGIWNYIAAMTNVAGGEKAKQQIMDVGIRTYQWEASEDDVAGGCFVRKADASLSYNQKLKAIRTTGRYDNTLNQITVLDVQYDDPTSADVNAMFHLYIPVLVKKLMNVSANVYVLEGTSYYAADYLDMKGKSYYSTAGFDEPVTAYIDFNYDRSREEWQTALDNGENLLWYYKKWINLIGSRIGDQSSGLPAGTKLTLLDKRKGTIYTYAMTADDEQKVFGFEKFPGFTEPYICDLLGINAEKNNDTGTYVEENDSEKATVKVGTVYYRLATDTEKADSTVDKYVLTIGDVVDHIENTGVSTDYLKEGEAFYLTIEVPKTANVNVINNLMQYSATRLTPVGLAPPTTVKQSQGGRYILYGGVEQSPVTVETGHIRDGSFVDVMQMEDKDSIQIILQTSLSLENDEVKTLFSGSYAPQTMYQQSMIYLKKYDQSGVGVPVSIGAKSAECYYEFYQGDTLLATTDKKTLLLQNEDRLLLTCGGESLPKQIAEAAKADQPLKIRSVVTLYYENIADQNFPQLVDVNHNNSGIGACAQSRVSNRQSLLSATKNSVSCEDKDGKRYYIEGSSFASLTYSTKTQQEDTESGDTNVQLGINANDPERNTICIDTVGKYDYTNVSSELLDQATHIRYTLELYQKDANGDYSGDPLRIGEYWSDVYMDNSKMIPKENAQNLQMEFDYDPDNQARVCYLPIRFTVKTGSEFEAKNLIYSNYKVQLTAVLMKGENEISKTKASDYIIYTNARVFQQIFE